MEKYDSNRWFCAGCSRILRESELLTAKNPFRDGDVIVGCPHCGSVNQMDGVCEVAGCNSVATCGTPTADGYRRLCGRHFLQFRTSIEDSGIQRKE